MSSSKKKKMKILLKKLYAWAVNLMQTIVSICSVLVFTKRGTPNLKTLSREMELKDECYLLGTGPSLKKVLETKGYLERKTFMVMNNFFRSEYFDVVKPRFIVLVDPAYFREINDDFSKASREDMIKAMNAITWEMTLIVPYEFQGSVSQKRIVNEKVKYCYINNIPVDGFTKVSHWFYRRNLGMPLPCNVMIAAIFCCINIGYKKVYLLGAEHSWTKDLRVNDQNQVCYYDDHFYDNKSMRVVPNTDISSMLLQISKGFNSHKQLHRYAESEYCEVYNLTEGSFIDAYPRKYSTSK